MSGTTGGTASSSSVELDFFGMQKTAEAAGKSSTSASSASKSQFQKLIEQRNNVRAVQTAMSMINPQLILKSVISEGKLPSENTAVFRVENQYVLPSLPVFNPSFRAGSENCSSGVGTQTTAPFTIFYNGTVSVFEIPQDKVEMIMKLAVEGSTKIVESAVDPINEQKNKLLEELNGSDLPIARKKSLQRFLQKRKERLTTTVSPYANVPESVMDKKQLEV